MIKEMKGWKVLTSKRQSARVSEWIDERIFTTFYPVGIKVVPVVPKTKLFFFKNKVDAIRFMFFHEIVVPCIAYNVSKAPAICHSHNSSVILFWNNRKNKKGFTKLEGVSTPPEGSYWADEIMCLE